MPDRDAVIAPMVLINGAFTMEALVDIRIEQSLDLPDRAILRYRDADPDGATSVLDTVKVGQTVEVELSSRSQLEPVFKGEVTELSFELHPGSSELVVVAHDGSHRLTHGTVRETYVKQSAADVIRAIASRNGLRAKVDGLTAPHEYLLQCSTDFEFLTALTRAEGARWYVDDRSLVVRRDDPSAGKPVSLMWGDNLRSFKARASAAEAATDVIVRGWDQKNQKVLEDSAPATSGLGMTSTAPLATEVRALGRDRAFKGTRFHGGAEPVNQSGTTSMAASMSRRSVAELVTARGTCHGEPSLRPGSSIDITGTVKRLAGKYAVSSVVHRYDNGRYECAFECGGASPRTLVDLLGSRSGAQSGGWAERGTLIGVVSNNRDPEGLGRVKVRFPTLDDGLESAWARVLSIGAGGGRGMQSIPEVTDEVLVAFEHGDTSHPVVLGGLWSGKNKPPGAIDSDSDKFFTLRSVRGSEMVLSDSKGKKNQFEVTLQDRGGLFRLGQRSTDLTSPTNITITGDKDITVKSLGRLTLDAVDIVIKASRSVSIEGAEVAVNGKQKVTTTAPTVEMTAQMKASLKSAGMTEVKGAPIKLN